MTDSPGVDRWRQVDDLFGQALDLDPDRWDPFLTERCGDDEDLRRAIAELLKADIAARQFLASSAAEIAAKALLAALQYEHSTTSNDRHPLDSPGVVPPRS